MRQLMKRFLCYGLLAFGLQTSWAYSLLGPVNNGVPANGSVADTWQQEVIGFNPISSYDGAPPYLGADSLGIGPKNIGEGYRRNTPVVYYGFDRNFSQTYFGVTGEQAVDQAFDILNSLTNVDSYSSNLVEFPMESQSQNYNLMSVELRDLKSSTLALMMEQMGLADAIRYTWVLKNRFHAPGNAPPCPAAMYYMVAMRNFDIVPSPLTQLQYSAYVNGELYTYYIPIDLCDQDPAPPDTDAVEKSADDLVYTQPVASGGEVAAGKLRNGFFYTGLTRDDAGGLRSLYSSNNINIERVPPGSTLISGSSGSTFINTNDEYTLTTSNLTTLVMASATNSPTALQTLYPGLVISRVVTNYSGTFTYTFANVVTNTLFANSVIQLQIQTTTIQPLTGWPITYGKLMTNISTSTTTTTSNIVSGDFFLIPTNLCGLDILSVLATNVTAVTNTFGTATNNPDSTTTVITSTNSVLASTNYTLLVAPCEFLNGATATTPTNGDYQGIERIQFVRVPDENIDSLSGNFVQPITNTYTLMVVPPGGSHATAQTFQRVLTRPDILFSAGDLVPGPGAINTGVSAYSRSVNFNQSNILPGLAGPGTIDPSVTVTFNKVGPILENQSMTFLTQLTASLGGYIWGSFDGSTNDPTVYPNGTSIATLESEALIQISPAMLPDATNGVPYYYYTSVGTNVVTSAVTLSVTGGGPSYTWMLATNSPALPAGLSLQSLSSTAVISGTPTNNPVGIYDFIIQMNDSSARLVQMNYSITIY